MKSYQDDLRMTSFAAYCLHFRTPLLDAQEEAPKLIFQEVFKEVYGSSVIDYVTKTVANDMEIITSNLFTSIEFKSQSSLSDRMEKSRNLCNSVLDLGAIFKPGINQESLMHSWYFYQAIYIYLGRGMSEIEAPGTKHTSIRYFVAALIKLLQAQLQASKATKDLVQENAAVDARDSENDSPILYPPPVKDVLRLVLNHILEIMVEELKSSDSSLITETWVKNMRAYLLIIHAVFLPEENDSAWISRHREKFLEILLNSPAITAAVNDIATLWWVEAEDMVIEDGLSSSSVNNREERLSKQIKKLEHIILQNPILSPPTIDMAKSKEFARDLATNWAENWKKFLSEFQKSLEGFPQKTTLAECICAIVVEKEVPMIIDDATPKENPIPLS